MRGFSGRFIANKGGIQKPRADLRGFGFVYPLFSGSGIPHRGADSDGWESGEWRYMIEWYGVSW